MLTFTLPILWLIFVLKKTESFPIKKITTTFLVYFFPIIFPSQGVLSKDPTIRLDGTGCANTCIPPSFPEPTLPFQVLHSRVDSWPYPQTLGQGGKACQGQTL